MLCKHNRRVSHDTTHLFLLTPLYVHHDDVIKKKPFPRYWPFVRGIHRSPVNSPHKGQWHGALMFCLICAWTNVWVSNRDAGDLRRHCTHYDVTVMHPPRQYTDAHTRPLRLNGIFCWKKWIFIRRYTLIFATWDWFSIKCHFTSIGILIVGVGRSYDRLISTMRFPTLLRRLGCHRRTYTYMAESIFSNILQVHNLFVII